MIRASFRDPQGRTWVGSDMVTRAAWSEPSLPDSLSMESLLRDLQAEGKWIPAKVVDPSTLQPLLDITEQLPQRAWQHPKIFFPSYAHEWSAAMLHQAAMLTLDINQQLLKVGWELKDATPTNVLFEGPRPIFVDHLSPLQRQPGQMGWTAYGQFIRTFLIPLCLHNLNGLPLTWIYLARRDGVSPEDASLQVSLLDRIRPSVIGLITLPTLLSRRNGRNPAKGLKIWKGGDESIGRAITVSILKGLRNRLNRWTPPHGEATNWSLYDQARESYTPEGLSVKEAFIKRALDTCCPMAVLDLGCNTGRYSRLAARAGARVVAVDGDPACVDRLWHQANSENLDIQPLVIDLGRPSPAMGWGNLEEVSFLERTKGCFDMVFVLALVHHLLVRERVPLNHIAEYIATLTTCWAVVEWVPPEDPQFQRLSGPNRDLYKNMSENLFETFLKQVFQIHQRINIPGGQRIIFLLKRLQ